MSAPGGGAKLGYESLTEDTVMGVPGIASNQ